MLGKPSNPIQFRGSGKQKKLLATESSKLENPLGKNVLDSSESLLPFDTKSVDRVADGRLDRSSDKQSKSPQKLPRLILAGATVCCVFGSISALTFWWLTTPPPSVNCREISLLSTDMDRLYCAQEAARSGELPKVLASIELLNQWSSEHPLYPEAQRLIAEWSKPVLSSAYQKIEQSDLQGAVELASRIPASSPVYQEAQSAIADWKTFWRKGEAIATAARKAMAEQNWSLANEKIYTLRDFPQDYWRFDQATALSKLLVAEQQGQGFLAQAKDLAQGGQPDQLGSAIALAGRIDSKTSVWKVAQPVLKQWSEVLLSLGFQSWLKGNLGETTQLANWVFQNPDMVQPAQDLLWLSQARRHALASTTSLKPNPAQIWNLTAAIATVALVQPESRFYRQAQTSLTAWQAQLQDLTLLQVASGVGEISLPFAKQVAIWQGQQVTANRPRRTQAQTLIASWYREFQELEDWPYLQYAQTLAGPGSIQALQNAIAQANRLDPKRPLHSKAQALIAEWTGQIQTIEDQPVLDQAMALANQGQLNRAMQVAGGIGYGRTLYWQAQSAISGWQAQIRASEQARQRQSESEKSDRSKESLNRDRFEPESTYPREEPYYPTSEPYQQKPSAEPEPFPVPENVGPPPVAPSKSAPPESFPSPGEVRVPTEPIPPPVDVPPPPMYQNYEQPVAPPPSR
jgi:hypothetical protein